MLQADGILAGHEDRDVLYLGYYAEYSNYWCQPSRRLYDKFNLPKEVGKGWDKDMTPNRFCGSCKDFHTTITQWGGCGHGICLICLRILKRLNKSYYSHFVCGYFNCKVQHSTEELINNSYPMLPWEQEEADNEAEEVRIHEVIMILSMQSWIPIDTNGKFYYSN